MRRSVTILAVTVLGLASCQPTDVRPTPAPPRGTESALSGPTSTPTAAHPPPTVPPTYRSYQDPQAGFRIWYPASWTVANRAPGSSFVVQSFEPIEAGSEGIPAGETKCDVIVRADVDTMDEAVEQVYADESLQVLAAFNEVQADGSRAIRLDVVSERTGEFGQVLAEIGGQVISVSCLGNQIEFDAISTSLQPIP